LGKDPLRGYEPGVLDYLGRCGNEDEAVEVITYLVNKGELDDEEARKLMKRIEREGLRAVSERREFGYYLDKYYDPDKKEYRKG